MSDAVISEDGRYRYELWRELPQELGDQRRVGTVLFIMLNPSTADHVEDDNTIRRCIGFARDWGYARLAVGNLFALRATDYKELAKVEDPVGPANDHHLGKLLGEADLAIAAWGAHARRLVKPREQEMRAKLRALDLEVKCLGTSKDGIPRHPLMLHKDTELEAWSHG